MQTITTVGFGDIPCVSSSEKIYAIFLMIGGAAFYSFLISNLQGNFLKNLLISYFFYKVWLKISNQVILLNIR